MPDEPTAIEPQPAWVSDLTKATIAIAIVFSFRYTGRLLEPLGLGRFGLYHVVFHWLVISWLVYRQLFAIRLAVKSMLLTRVLNPEFWFTRWLKQHNQFLVGLAVIAALITGADLAVYVYVANAADLAMIALDIALFVWLHRTIRMEFSDRVFQPDIAHLIREFTPVVVNVLVLFILVTLISFREASDVFPVGDPQIPEYVIDHVSHPWKPFQMLARTVAFLELNIKSLRTLPYAGWFLYIAVYISTVSLVPLTGASLTMKSAVGFGTKGEMK